MYNQCASELSNDSINVHLVVVVTPQFKRSQFMSLACNEALLEVLEVTDADADADEDIHWRIVWSDYEDGFWRQGNCVKGGWILEIPVWSLNH